MGKERRCHPLKIALPDGGFALSGLWGEIPGRIRREGVVIR
ncbi:hypothetical protein HMPREF0208_03441 [Citrobacter koseri]|nr:hypothetical protein HMPREF3207_01811 [Citrobacter koseri]KXA03901.1 hypothetical protein HMPREF3220_00509 [Citrobacter koseri]KXB41910.1 hypothetical protein HMPREF0208_03441 [Citrobacter koseri]